MVDVDTVAVVDEVFVEQGNFTVKILVPMVGTECDTDVMVPGVCKLLSRCVLPDCFGPKQRQIGVDIMPICTHFAHYYSVAMENGSIYP